MSDFLQNKWLKKAVKQFSLPVPVPYELKRLNQAVRVDELEEKIILLGSLEKHFIKGDLAAALAKMGAIVSTDAQKAHAILMDLSGLDTLEELNYLHRFLSAHLKKVKGGGRIIVLCPEVAEKDSVEKRSVIHSVEGVTRSLARELGKRGTTVQLVRVSDIVAKDGDAIRERILPVVYFLLSSRSSFITGQVWHIDERTNSIGGLPIAQSLKGKTALVTGAGRGIGAKTAKVLAREGAEVIMADLASQSMEMVDIAEQLGGKAFLLDVTAEDALQQVRDFMQNKVGKGLDILVNNAGITRDKTLAKMPEHYWDLVMAVNFKAVMDLSQGLMKEGMNDGGRIISLSSISGIGGNLGQTNYSATKAGVIELMRAMATEGAGRGITTNALAPGFIETKMTAKVPLMVKEAARRLCSLGQGGLPIDIAEAITFLASPGAVGITGQTIRVCGGSFLGA